MLQWNDIISLYLHSQNHLNDLSLMTTKKMISLCAMLLWAASALAQIGTRFPSERKVMKDPKTGVELVFLTSKSGTGDSKIYQTHNQWTSDGRWVIFRSDRVKGEAMAVNEQTGDIVQVTEGGYTGMLCVARRKRPRLPSVIGG